MGNIFSGSEIVEIGIQIEKNGRDFYNTAADKSKEPEAKELFKFLAGEEEKHITVFKKILDSVEKYEPAEAYPGEYFSYMNSLASEYVFTQKDKGKEIAKALKTDKEVVDKGIGFEKDSITFYQGVKKAVPEYDKKTIDQLIVQEQSHLQKLTEIKSKL
ncbi:MAG: ferritin family protein [Candidatus Omnitrophica bacterium]|nr:ferritin family protein [Candidatus Omnitrophota bacterium]